ncbi:MAG: uracil-DNA glycosylase [Deltaproteobacteria bacterium]|nr:uracil-DNA glycosylase [Deltaproteobacteria bacterium]
MESLSFAEIEEVGEELDRLIQKVSLRDVGTPDSLDRLNREVQGCSRCDLAVSRKAIVFGEGSPTASLVFVGEAPGRDEDLAGRPFVGEAGQLLTRIIHAINLRREDVYIANVVKCRPPHNRDPKSDEIQACFPFLLRQLDVIRPRVICALGKFAAQTLLGTTEKISSLRGTIHEAYNCTVVPTYHPASLLRNPQWKREVWQDMQRVQKLLEDNA